jgi:hypothetical protein
VTFALGGRTERSPWIIAVDFIGSEASTKPVGSEPLSTLSAGAGAAGDSSSFGTRAFRKIAYAGAWRGIDLEWSAEGGYPKSTYVIQPGADPGRIRLAYRGGRSVTVTSLGRLRVSTGTRAFEEERPYAYQQVDGKRVEVAASFIVVEDVVGGAAQVGFRFGEYDRRLPLVLDPVALAYCGFLGGTGDDVAEAVDVDSDGNAYVSGFTSSPESTFPETVGPDLTFNGGTQDVFAAKLNSSGTAFYYLGYIGGSGTETNEGIAVDTAGNAHISGGTDSNQASFPVIVGPDLTYNGGTRDAFVAKLNPDGTALVFAGYIGGTAFDNSKHVALDSSGNVYVLGATESTEATFLMSGGLDPTHNGGVRDAYLAKVSSAGTGLVFAGYIGGTGYEDPWKVAVDSAGNAYVVGDTTSTEATFPVSVGPDLTYNGGSGGDAFVAKVSSAGTGLVWCGYIGGTGTDEANSLDLDTSGDIYVAGDTYSNQATFPVSGGPDVTQNGSEDIFIAKVSSAGTGLIYCGYIGGNGQDQAQGLAVDTSGNAYMTGRLGSLESSVFPERLGPDLSFQGGTNDILAAKVNSAGTALEYAGYIGGTADELGQAIAVDSSGNVFIVGQTDSTESSFPPLFGPGFTHKGGSNEGFMAKVVKTTASGLFAGEITRATGNNVSSLAWNHHGAEEANGLLMVGVAIRTTTSTVSTVTFGSQSLTHVPSGATNNGTDCRVELWYALAPASGLASLTVNLSGSSNVTTGALTLTGVSQTTPFDAYTANTGTSTTPSVSVGDSEASNVVVDVMAMQGQNGVSAVGGGQTQEWTHVTTDATSSQNVRGAGSTEPGAAAVTMSYTMSASDIWAIGAVSINPANTTAVRLEHFTAEQGNADEPGVWLRWRTGFEHDNLGFHVYREEAGGQRARVTTSLVAGSALFAGAGVALSAGRSYSWLDEGVTASHGWRYWLEELDLGGKSRWHGPVSPIWRSTSAGRGGAVALQQSPLLDKLGRGGEVVSDWQRRAPWRPSRVPAAAAPPMSRPGAKVDIREEGWYRVGLAELRAAGLSADPATLRLFAEGEEQSLMVAGDAVEFYGIGADTPWTDARPYVFVDGSGARRSIPTVEGKIADGPSSPSFPATIERRYQSVYFAALKNGEAENFFGPAISRDPVEVKLLVESLAPAPATSAVEIVLQGVTEMPHRVEMSLNGVALGDVDFWGQRSAGLKVAVPAGLLVDGENTVVLSNRAGDRSVSLLGTLRLTYPRAYRAKNDVLRFSAPPGRPVTIGGFSRPDIRALDVRDPSAPVELIGAVRSNAGAYEMTLTVPSGSREVLAFAGGEVKRAAGVKRMSGVIESTPADLFILTHGAFRAALDPLVTRRQQEGLRVVLVDVEDVYDSYGWGQKSPWALRRFLEHARNQRGAKFVLLVGDASVDPRNHLGRNAVDFVPTKLVETNLLETASDDWLADFDGDGVPELALGRLPARSEEETARIVRKIVDHRLPKMPLPVFLLSGKKGEIEFANGGEALLAGLAAGTKARHVRLDSVSVPAARGALASFLEEGPGVVEYFGHGSVEVWADGLLDSAGVGSLGTGHPAVAVALTCLNGFFHDVYSESLAESLLRTPRGGALGVWASSGLTYPHEQIDAGQVFVRALGAGARLGEAAVAAKASGTENIRQTWILLGDPSMRLSDVPEGVPGPADEATGGGSAEGGCGCRLGAGSGPSAFCALTLLVLIVGRFRRRRRFGPGRWPESA